MRGIKDFFHDTNDIALAIVVVLIAAGLIVWRMHIILQYPAEMAKAAAASSGTQTEETQNSASSSESK